MNKAHYTTPGNYRIQVQGLLGADWSGRFGAMRIFSQPRKAGSTVTILQGSVRDQAELSGILNTLYELHLPLLSVQFMGDDQ